MYCRRLLPPSPSPFPPSPPFPPLPSLPWRGIRSGKHWSGGAELTDGACAAMGDFEAVGKVRGFIRAARMRPSGAWLLSSQACRADVGRRCEGSRDRVCGSTRARENPGACRPRSLRRIRHWERRRHHRVSQIPSDPPCASRFSPATELTACTPPIRRPTRPSSSTTTRPSTRRAGGPSLRRFIKISRCLRGKVKK